MAEAEDNKIQVQLRIERIFLKDASFEAPGGMAIFNESFRPEMQVDINTRVANRDEDRHEVVLSATVQAKLDGDKTAYIVEVHQAGVFEIRGLASNQLGPVIGIHCPQTLFPYLRENIDALVVKGGFPPLQLAPVNFEALFQEAVRQQQAQTETH